MKRVLSLFALWFAAIVASGSVHARLITVDEIKKLERSGQYLEAARLWSSLALDSEKLTSGSGFASRHWLDAAGNFEKAGDINAQRQALERAYATLSRVDQSERYQVQAALAKFYAPRNPNEALELARELINNGKGLGFDAWGFGLSCLTTAVATESLKDSELTTTLYRTGFDTGAADLDSRMEWLSNIYERGIRFAQTTGDASLEALIQRRLEANRAAWSSADGTPAGEGGYALRAGRAYRARASIYRKHDALDLATFAAKQADYLTSRP